MLKEKLGVKTILGLTATATTSTVRSILDQFGLDWSKDPEAVISDVPLPDNLLLSISQDEDRDMALLNLISSERFASCQSVIIYCTRREQCDKISGFLRTALQVINTFIDWYYCITKYSLYIIRNGNIFQAGKSGGKIGRLSMNAEAYHAGLSAARRKQVQKAFMSGKIGTFC